MTSISDYATQIMAAIDADTKAGLIPAAVASFSELHDYVDANDYALEAVPFNDPECTCARTMDSPDCSCGHDVAWFAYMQYLNEVESEVSRRLAARTMTTEDDRWQQAYNNAAELFFGKVAGDTLTEEEDAACIADANARITDES